MPFGLQSAPTTFQRLIDQVIRGLKGTAAYLDDIIVFSQDWESHLAELRAVLRRLKEAGPLTVRPKKYSLGMRQCIYLGHVVGNGCVQPEASKVEAVRDFPRPTTKKQVRVFLGLSGYYRRFIPRYPSISTPLTDLTKKNLPFKVQWTRQCEEAFIKLKQCLCTLSTCHGPRCQLATVLTVNLPWSSLSTCHGPRCQLPTVLAVNLPRSSLSTCHGPCCQS